MQAQMAKAQEEARNETSRPPPAAGWSPSRPPARRDHRDHDRPEAIDPDDPELLADMVMAAVNEALRSAQDSLMESS